MYSNKIVGNTDCLIVLMIGNFKHSTVGTIFTQNFINILSVGNTKEAITFINNNHIDVVVFENNSVSNSYNLLEEIKELDKSFLTILVEDNLSTESLLKCIELKLDCYLHEESQLDNLLIQLNKVVSQYLINKHHERFGSYFNVENEKISIFKVNKVGRISYVNNEYCDTSGYTYDELLGFNLKNTGHPDNKKSIFENLWHTIHEQKLIWKGILKNISKKGETYYTKTIIVPLLDENKNIIEFIGYQVNISETISDENRLLNNIEINGLSVLALIQIEEYEILEKFYDKNIIEKIENFFGNALLSNLPDKDIFQRVYSLGEGKYAFLCNFYHFIEKNVNIEKYLHTVIQKTKSSVFVIDSFTVDLNVVLSFSFGHHDLFKDAKYGLEEAILKNKMVHNSNDASLREENVKQKNMNIIKMVKIALDNHKIVSYFQPIINNKTQVIEKHESLVRLIDENNRVFAPISFLNNTKFSHYYNRITNRVLENSFSVLSKINTDVSINISMSDIETEETRNLFFLLLHKNKKYAHKLILELLEDENVNDFKVIENFINEAKSKGVKIAIDDFGTGHSNFERLLFFKPDIIKIDGSLIKDIEHNAYSRHLVETIASLSKKENIKTVAEYVENENIFNILNEIGIDYSQGYFFGKPEKFDLNE